MDMVTATKRPLTENNFSGGTVARLRASLRDN